LKLFKKRLFHQAMQHRLEVEEELAALGRTEITFFVEIHIALGGDIPHRADGVVELFAQLLQPLACSGSIAGWLGQPGNSG
jgi:hypothetical protein